MPKHSRKKAAITVQLLRGLEMPVQFVFALIAARALGASSYGVVGIYLAIQSIALVVCTFGYDELLQRGIAAQPARLWELLMRAIRARVLAVGGLSALLLVYWFSATALGSDTAGVALTFGTALALNLLSGPFLSAGLSLYRPFIPIAASLLGWLYPLSLALLGQITNEFSYGLALAGGAAIRFVVSVIWGFSLYQRQSPRPPMKVTLRRPQLLDRWSSHLSLAVYGLNNQILARHGDIIVAGVMGISLALIGTYSLAFQMASTANIFLMLGLGAIGLSHLSEHSADSVRLSIAWRKLTYVAALLACAPLVVLALVAPEIDAVLLKEALPSFVPLLLALVCAQWLSRVGGGGTNIGALIAMGETTYVARSSLLGSLLNLVLAVALVPLLGVYALPVATGVAALAIGISNARRIHLRLGILPPLRSLATMSICVVAAVAITLSGVTWEIRWSMALLVIVMWSAALIREARH